MASLSNSRFDFAAVAADYDAWYETDVGRLHDVVQKEAVLSLLPARTADGIQKLLDAGCGSGHWSVFFAEHGFEVTGIDICPEMVAIARKRNVPHCHFEVADVMKLPFQNGAFDIVSALVMLEFVRDARAVCVEMIRCLKSDGCLMVGALNRLARINRERIAARVEPYASARMFAPKEVSELLTPFGDVNIRLTEEHKSGSDESGAFIVAAVMKP